MFESNGTACDPFTEARFRVEFAPQSRATIGSCARPSAGGRVPEQNMQLRAGFGWCLGELGPPRFGTRSLTSRIPDRLLNFRIGNHRHGETPVYRRHSASDTAAGIWVQSCCSCRLSRVRRLPSNGLGEKPVGKRQAFSKREMRSITHFESRPMCAMLLYPSTRSDTRAPCLLYYQSLGSILKAGVP